MIRLRCFAMWLVALALALGSQAGALTWFTVNGQTSGTVTTPASLVLRANTAATGNMLRLIVGVDKNEDGTLDAGEPIVANEPYEDQAFNDEDTAARVVQNTIYLTQRMSAHYVIRLLDENGTYVEHAFDFIGAAQPESISGAVRDQTGSPIAGAIVDIISHRWGGGEHTAFTDSSGSFSLAVPPGRYEVSVAWPGARVPRMRRVLVGASQSVSGVNFVVDTSVWPYTISGNVAVGSEPVPGAIVAATDGYEVWGFTDINGNYTLHVDPGTYQVFPVEMPPGYYYAGSGQATSVPPSRTGVNFSALETSYYIWGTLRDALSNPIPGAEVEATSSFFEVWGAGNQYGKYVCLLPPGTWEVEAMADGYSMNSSDMESVTVPPQPTLPVDFTLTSNSITVSGQVRLQGGGAVPYALVHANSVSPPWEANSAVRADASGNYVLHLAPGSYHICAISELVGWSGCTSVVDATSNRTGVDVTLQLGNVAPTLSNGNVSPQSGPAGTTFTFQVTYTDADNDPPAQVYVVIDGWPREMPPANPGDTDYTDGAVFSLAVSGLAAGSHTYWFGALEEGVLVDFEFGYDLRLPDSGSYIGPSVGGTGDPSVAITFPAQGSTVEGQITVTATASDPDGIQKVEFYDGATLASTDLTAPYQWVWDTASLSVAEGVHNITAKAYDNTAHTAQATIQVTVDNTTFDDVPKTSSQWPYIEALVREGITGGCSTTPPLYCPLSSITRAQMAVFLCRAAGKAPLNRDVPTFSDVPKTHWAYGYIERLADPASWPGGVAPTTGCATTPTRLFCPDETVKRDQMAVFLCRATGKTALDRTVPTFDDVPKTHWAYGYIERLTNGPSWPGGVAVTSGCAVGPPRLYCPASPNTRGQMAVFLVRAFGIPL